jgi:hypothetical protein
MGAADTITERMTAVNRLVAAQAARGRHWILEPFAYHELFQQVSNGSRRTGLDARANAVSS